MIRQAAKALAQRLVRGVVSDYRLNWIYASPARLPCLPLPLHAEIRPFRESDREQVERNDDAQFRKALGYERIGATGFVLAEGDVPISIAHFVDKSLYDRPTTWPLRADQIALVNIVTAPLSRGKGLAASLIAGAASFALERRFTTAICYIWWNHKASIGAFRRAGWRRIGLSIELVGRNGRVRWLHIPLRSTPSRSGGRFAPRRGRAS